MTTIAFTGLGRMGLPMAVNLLKAGFSVIGYDLDSAKMAVLTKRGGTQARSPAEAALSDISLSIIMNDAILRDVAMGENGVLKGARSGHIYCDLSTVSPSASGEVWTEAAKAELIICAPRSGPMVGQKPRAGSAGGSLNDRGLCSRSYGRRSRCLLPSRQAQLLPIACGTQVWRR